MSLYMVTAAHEKERVKKKREREMKRDIKKALLGVWHSIGAQQS